MAKGSKIAGKAMGMAKAAGGAIKGERGIFLELRKEHGVVSALMNRIANTTDGDTRRGLFLEFKREILSHSKGEEAEFYPVLKDFEETSDIVGEALEDHRAVEITIDKLSSMDFDSEAWGELFVELMNDIQDHVEQEENELFPAAQLVLDDETARRIEERFMLTRNRVMQKVA